MKSVLHSIFSKKVLFLILLSSVGFFSWSQTTETFTTTGANSWICPAGVTSVTVETWGGGGRGGSRVTTGSNGYGGASGGAYSKKVITVNPGTTYYFLVGAGATNTSNGASSWFNASTTSPYNSTNAAPTVLSEGVLAKGGASVANNTTTGAAIVTGSIGDVINEGGAGVTGVAGSYGGAGGSSGGVSVASAGATGVAGTTSTASASNPTGSGKGGNGASSNGSGSAGSQPGGGGGGALRTSSGSPTGGNGGNGQVILTYTQPACSGTPAPGNTVASVNPVVNAGTTVLSLQNATSGSGVTYQWQSSPDGTTWTNVPSGGTNATYTTSLTADTYFQCVVTCSGNTGTSNSLLVTHTVSYCTPSSATTTYYITGVTTSLGIANINNTGTSYGLSSGYSDYSSTLFASAYANNLLNFTVALAGNATTDTYSYGVAIWVDWNNDGVFTNATERVYNSAAYVYSASGSFTIPNGTSPGSYRMRVVADYNATSPNSCSFNNTFTREGEAEDYTIKVVLLTPCSGTPAPGNTVASVNPVSNAGTTILYLQNGDLGSGVTYQWQSSPNGTTWTNVPSGGTSSTYTASPTTDTYYQCIVTCTNSSSSSTSTPLLVTHIIAYCTPTSATTTYYITGVTTTGGSANISNTGTSYGLVSGYSDYSSTLFATSYPNSTLNFTVALAGNATTDTYSYGVAIWVDWNNDGVFTDATERVYNSNAYVYSASGSFTIPNGTLPGSYRMRVLADYYLYPPSSCSFDSFGPYGEAEDYTIKVFSTTPNCATLISPADAATGVSQLATLNWDAVLDATYNVYFGTNNPPTDIVNGTNQSGTSYTPAAILNPTTTYYWRIEPKNSLNNTASCSTWSFTTQAAAPSISATALTSFSACVGSLSNANTFVINGINLTGTNITITAPTNCTISEDDINYYSSIDVNHSSGTISNKTIYVKLTPSAEGAYSDNIVISNGGLSTNVNVAVTGTGNRVFNGTYTVGSSGAYDYPTLTAAVTAYNNIQCITGDVVFRLMDANYSSAETFPIVINNISNDANYTLTIRPATTATIINSSNLTASAIIKINDVHHIIIDGSNNGTTSKDLTITNNNSTTTSAAIWIGSSVYGAYNIIVKNCNISGNNANTTVAGVIAGSNITMGDAAGAPNSYITIDNNTITAAQNALYYSGEASSHDDHLTVTNNIFGSSVAANRLGYRGMFLGNVDNFLVDGNTINGVYYSGSSSVIGIQLGFLAANGTITKNKIYDIKNSSTLGYGSCGIYLSNTSTTANLNVSNNFISDVASYGYNGVTSADNGNGIFIYSGGGYNIDHNTINLATSQTAANGNPAAINISSNFTTTGGINLRNNIFSIPATVGKRYAIYCGAANTVFNTIDYNDYYSAGTNIGFLGANQATLGAIQTAFGGNLNSKNIAPVFVNAANNLHLIPASNTTLDNLGTPLAAITNDIDLESRSLTTPDMGADEFNSSTLAVSLLSLTGAKEGTRNILRWVTATETNNNGFEVQRSTDGIHYNAIGYVQSLATGGNSSSNLSYLFTDNTFTGTIQYYRLRQVDNDNTSHLSNVVVIREANPVVLSITELYPNPASSFINVVISSPMSDKVTAVITDVLGKTILQKQLAVEKGNNVVSFNIAQLASGTYFVKLTCNNNCPKAVSRFVKK